jgi:pimeloyl-ACP methyl ester carboxylesterase
MADDVVALMDALKIAKADIVGWSDGAILGIDLELRHKDRRRALLCADSCTS